MLVHYKHLLLGMAIALPITLLAQCTPAPSSIYTFWYNGVKYEVIKENTKWSEAAACAVKRGGKLAEINSRSEQDTVYAQLNKAGIVKSSTTAPDGGGASYVWLGGSDKASEGQWIWDGANSGKGTLFWQGNAGGNPVNGRFTNWGNEPDDFDGQDALGLALTAWPMGTAGEWNDVDEDNKLYYVIEYNPAGISPEQGNSRGWIQKPGTRDLVLADFQGESPDVYVYSMTGSHVARYESHELNTGNWENGLYFIRWQNGGKWLTQRWIKTND